MFDLQFSSSMQDSLITMRRIVFASPECAGHVEGIFINLWGDRSFIIQVLGPSKLAGLSKSDRKTPGKYHGSFYNGKLKGNPFWLDQQKNWSSSRNWGFGKAKKTSPKNWLPGTVHNPTKAKDCQQQQKLDSYRKGCSEKVLISKVFAGAAPQPKSPPCSLRNGNGQVDLGSVSEYFHVHPEKTLLGNCMYTRSR